MKNLPYYLFIFSLIFAPLAFGTVEHWSLAGLEVTVALAFTLYFILAWYHRETNVRVVGLLPFSLLLLFIALQLIPLPQDFIRAVSPSMLEVYRPVIDTLDPEKWIPLTADRRATLHELLRLTSCFATYVLTIQLLSSPERLKRTTNIVVFSGAVVALFALVQNFTSPDKIYWFRQAPPNSSPFGPWVNPNQYAGYIELICPLALGLFLFYRPRTRGDESLRERFVSFFSMPGIHLHLFLGLAAVITCLSVFVSLCRGGMLSLLFAGFVFLFLYNLKFPKKSRGTLILFIVLVWAAISWFGWGTIIAEFNHSFDESGRFTDGRLTLWSDTWRMIRDFPLVGSGFATFLPLYPSYKTIDDALIYAHAHNDYLELLTDGGLVGFALGAWFVLAVLGHGWKMVRLRNDHYSVLLGIGALAAIMALAAHSVTDFNLHNGAVGFYFSFVCGLLVAAVNSRFSYHSQGTLLKKRPAWTGALFSVAGMIVLAATVFVQYGSFSAVYLYNSVKSIYISTHLAPEKVQFMAEVMKAASRRDPLDGLYYHKLGSLEWYLGDREAALHHHALAGYRNPLEGVFLYQLGRLTTDPEMSEVLVEEGFRRALNKEDLAQGYVDWLFWKGRRSEALEIVRQFLQEDYQAVDSWMVLFNSYDVTRDELQQILPRSVEAWLHLGRYSELHGAGEDAGYFFSGALGLLSESGEANPQWFRRIIHYYQRQKLDDGVLAVTRQAVELIPDFPEFHLILGDYYVKDGITYRAKEEYEQVLILDPGNAAARKRLRQMGFGDAY
jgi:O-antigen ligase